MLFYLFLFLRINVQIKVEHLQERNADLHKAIASLENKYCLLRWLSTENLGHGVGTRKKKFFTVKQSSTLQKRPLKVLSKNLYPVG